MSRVLGVDPGEVRVGLAISDPDRLVASPLRTITAGDDLVDSIATTAREEYCETVVVGLPRSLAGRDTASTRSARALARALEERGLEVDLWDERLSSVEAERLLLDADRRRAQRRSERDRVAAAIVLQGWLDAHRRPHDEGPPRDEGPT